MSAGATIVAVHCGTFADGAPDTDRPEVIVFGKYAADRDGHWVRSLFNRGNGVWKWHLGPEGDCVDFRWLQEKDARWCATPTLDEVLAATAPEGGELNLARPGELARSCAVKVTKEEA